MDHTIELNPLTCIWFVRTGKLNVSSIQHNRRMLSSGKSRNDSNSTDVVEEIEERNKGRKRHRPSKTNTAQVRPCNASFNTSCDDNNEFDDEMLAGGKVLVYGHKVCQQKMLQEVAVGSNPSLTQHHSGS